MISAPAPALGLSCRPFNLTATVWGSQINWGNEVRTATHALKAFLLSCEGKAVKYPLTPAVYLVSNQMARRFPNMDTLFTMGFQVRCLCVIVDVQM
jgi:hypothetical protein